MVYFVLGINYMLSLGQYLEKSSCWRLFFWLYEVNGKILCIPEIVPLSTMLELDIGWKGVDRSCLCLLTFEESCKLLIITFTLIWYSVNKCCSCELHLFCNIIFISDFLCLYTPLTFLYKDLLFCLNIVRFEHFKLSVWQSYQSNLYVTYRVYCWGYIEYIYQF